MMYSHLSRSTKGLAIALLASFSVVAATVSPTVAQDSATPSAASECNVEQAVGDAPTVYTLVSEDSTASYTVMEELASIGSNEVVGTTNSIIGSILFDEEGNPLPCSNFAVDMRTLVTDENRRDNYLRSNTLESDTFPFALFVVSSVEGLDGPLEDGETVVATIIGDLTLHGVTQPTEWEAEFTMEGDTLTGTATHTFLIADYEMEKPIVGPVVGIDDEVTLDIGITATVNAEA